MGVYQALDRDWEQISTTPAAARHLARWAAAEPALAGFATPRELVEVIAQRGRAARSHELLRCLLRQAADPLAARTLLQAVLPALRSAKVWQPVEDNSAERVAATWEAIRVHAGESPEYPARFVIRIAERRLRTVREAQRRYATRQVAGDVERHAPPLELDDVRPAADRVAVCVIDALRSGTLSAAQARLLYAASGVPHSASTCPGARCCRPSIGFCCTGGLGAGFDRARDGGVLSIRQGD
jgi:hypothetical protein